MEAAEKNLRYFSLERQLLRLVVASGLCLWLLYFAALKDIESHIFDFLWVFHLFFHTGAILWTARLLARFSMALHRRERIFYGLVFASVAGFASLLAALPIVSRDALLYHLAVPKFWLEAGRIVEIPWHEWSHFPLLLSLAYAGMLKHSLVQAAPYYHLSYLFLVSGVVAAFTYYKFQREDLTLVATLLCFMLPVCLRVGIEPMADLALAFYFGLAFSLFIFWGEQRGGQALLISIGLLLGFALCCKYNAILAVAVFCLCALSFLQRWNYGLVEVARILALVLLPAFLIFLPWPLKNYLNTGNPLYPFAGGLFGVSDEIPFMGAVGPIQYRLLGYKESWTEILLIPLRMLVTGEDDNPRQFDGLLSPILLFALAALVLRPPEGRLAPWVRNSALFIVSYFLLSLNLFYALLRYQSPALVPAICLTAAGLALIGERLGEARRAIFLRSVLSLQFLWTGYYAYGWWNRSLAGHYFVFGESAENYLSERLDEYESIKYVNSSLPRDAKIYLLFTGNRFFYYERNVRGSYFSQMEISAWLKASPTSAHLREKFRELGITHLAIQNSRTKASFQDSLDSAGKAAWTEFVSSELELLTDTGRGQTVWRLR